LVSNPEARTQIKEYEMGKTCNMHGEMRKIHSKLLSENLKRTDHFGGVGVDARLAKWT
jgi:hypothetical protein